MNVYLSGSQLILIRWNFNKPGQEAPIINQRLPLCLVPKFKQGKCLYYQIQKKTEQFTLNSFHIKTDL